MGFGHFFHSIVHGVSGVIQNAIHNPIATIADIAAVATGQPEIAAIGNAANTAVKGGSLTQSLISGATAYATSAIGNSVSDYANTSSLGRALGGNTSISSLIGTSDTYGPAFVNPGIGDIVGQDLNNQIGARIANATIGSAIGGAVSLGLTSTSRSGSDISTVSPSQANSATSTNTATGASAPGIGSAAVQQTGDDVARAAAEASGRTASILSDQSDDEVTGGNPNILKRKSLLSD